MNWKRLCSVLLCLGLVWWSIWPAYAAEPITLGLEIEAQLNGEAPAHGEPFTFILEPVDQAPMPEDNTLTITGEGVGQFSPITYTAPETYHYTIREAAGDTEGYTYDDTVYHVTVQVTTNDGGLLAQSISISKQGSLAKTKQVLFINHYTPTSPSNPEPSGEAPQTGDQSNLTLWITLGSVALLGLMTTVVLSGKKRKQNRS